MIADDVVQEVKRRTDIGAVIGQYVKLKRRGKNLVGLCPFHSEKTPSFNVHPDEGFYKCFGCGKAGDVFTFLEAQTGQAFPDIVRGLAEQAGVEVPEQRLSPEQIARKKEREDLTRVLELAQMFFRQRLAAEEEGRAARAYLDDARKIAPEVRERFGLGFGGARDNGPLHYLEREGISAERAASAGVLAAGRRGPYDFFRGRVTFPIREPRGRVVGFAGRIFGKGAEKRPKYVNGPQTPVYDKSTVLFGLHEALPGLKQGKPAVLVEGQLDVLATHAAEFPTGVAPCGTSLTPRHVETLRRYTERVVLCLDADSAGQAATERSVLLCLRGGMEVAICELIEGDPDDMVKEGQGAAFKTRLEAARPALDLYIERAVERATGSMTARIRALQDLLPYLAATQGDELARRQYIKRVARAFAEDEEFLLERIAKEGPKELNGKIRRGEPQRRPEPRPAPRRPAPPKQPSDRPPSAQGAPPESEGPPWEMAPPPDAAPFDDDVDAGQAAGPTEDDDIPELSPEELEELEQHQARTALARKMATPGRRWSIDDGRLAEALLCHPQLAPRCGVLAPELKNHELRRFIEMLTDALVRYHDEEPREVLQRLSVPTEVARRAVRIAQQGGLADPERFFPESAAAQLIEDFLRELDRRPDKRRLAEIQRGIESATERGDETSAREMVAAQTPVVRSLTATRSAPPSLPGPDAPPRLQLVEPVGFDPDDPDDPDSSPPEEPADREGPEDAILDEEEVPAEPRPGALSAPRGSAMEPDSVELPEDEDFIW